MKRILRILGYLAGAAVASAAVENTFNNLQMTGTSNELGAGYTFTLRASSLLTTVATSTVTLTNSTVNYPVGQILDAATALANKPSARAVATANVSSLSGTTTIDGVALTAGQLVLLTAQTTASQNGPWIVQSSTWTRPSWYPAAGTSQAFYHSQFLIREGTANSGSLWFINTTGVITIDTTAVTITQIKLTLASTSVAGTLPAANLPSLISVVTDSNSSLTEKPVVKAVSTSNVASLSGTTTIDGVALAATDPVLLTAQTTASQNGPWLVQSSTWTRPTWYVTSNTTQSFYGIIVPVVTGTLNAGTRWYVTTTGAITIGTTSTAWTKIPGNGGTLASLTDVTLTSPSSTQVLTYNGSAWVNQNPTGGGGGVQNGIIGSATFDAHTGTIASLVTKGCISAVTRVSAGKFTVTLSPAQSFYTVSMTMSDDATSQSYTYISGTSTSSTSFTYITVNVSGTPTDRTVNMVTVFGPPTAGYILVSDQKASTTVGGTATASAWTTRALQTVDTDTTGTVTISANAATIPAGTYRVRARAPFFQTGTARLRLFDQTNSAVLLIGSSTSSTSAAADTSADSIVTGRFTAATAIAIRLEYFVASAAGGTSGLGVPSGTASTVERYSEIELIKE